MLYRTHHHPFVLSFNPFTLISSSAHSRHHSSTTLLPRIFSSYSIQAEQGMDCLQGALKSCSRQDMAVKTTQLQMFSDDFCVVNGQNGVSGDDLFVDDLLDFSNGFVEEEGEELQEREDINGCAHASPKQGQNDNNPKSSTITSSIIEDFCSLPGSELSVPEEDLANLEWLSHFVEDSFTGYPLTCSAAKLAEQPRENHFELLATVETKPCFTTPVQTKARSKRPRTGGRVWSLGSPSLTDSSSTSSSSSSSTISSPPSNPWLVHTNPYQTAESILGKPPAKKHKKKIFTEPNGVKGAPQPRRCSHCGVQKTPQWRAGPLGAKTLCNACGVRFKSGRLLPEYRPACSPTFSSELHSNNHRKVLEMRRKKEMEAGLLPPVQSY